MRRQLPAALGMVLLFTLLTGVVYPLVITGIARVGFAERADGALLEIDGRVVGSARIAQSFTEPQYFHPRPSAIDYDARDSGGANLGPTNPELLEAIEQDAEDYRVENGLADDAPVPVDAVTMSASGLDPDISPANARLQASRVAEARGVAEDDVLALVEEHTTGRAAGFLGEAGVNVLELNLALDLAPDEQAGGDR